ncbi:MAG: HD domain-containing protein [Muribaculaceae bacterium]|nr:HD domain-containing protein [Muribaculaceae bacterium]
MDIQSKINLLFDKIYEDNPELRRIVFIHSSMVANKALDIAIKKKLPLKKEDIYAAGMLHDIGVINCNAPGIHAFGNLPYICHGIEGGKILRENGFEKYASVCERHTGAGLSVNDIKNQNLPLPEKDFSPQTLLEKLICYADKFFSKSKNLTEEKPLSKIIQQMKNHGEESYYKFLQLHSLFSAE